MDIDEIADWHAHIYFDQDTTTDALALRALIEARFEGNMEMGRFHEKPVGPHPKWSYQVLFRPDRFADIVPWLTLNRGRLTVFVHPNTGDALVDHRDRAVWLGDSVALDLSVLER
ncbi:DOPA 4,5-dioxygenase [Stella humosa]|uniref:DOPA 4,5-dioxygenase n=1 Tax=Stella humosa TaxID=94 RepID=A0A3N1KS92_9PROT|nr:DOPA 4,5-dioxygenase family protein [Stella humosa]ROP83451.1 DOPA 4,5-dioxygenase [Stella humosa]BBK33277.1 DOPA 4,5-dioxygenase [Stella humosa]